MSKFTPEELSKAQQALLEEKAEQLRRVEASEQHAKMLMEFRNEDNRLASDPDHRKASELFAAHRKDDYCPTCRRLHAGKVEKTYESILAELKGEPIPRPAKKKAPRKRRRGEGAKKLARK